MKPLSEWVSSFLTAHQHILGYLVPYSDVEDTVKEIRYNQGYLAMNETSVEWGMSDSWVSHLPHHMGQE